MKKSIFQYLLMMGAIAAPTKASDTATVVPQTPKQLLEAVFRFLSMISKLLFILIGLTILWISMLPTVPKPLVFLATGFCKICYTLIAGLSAVAMVLTENTDMSIFGIIVSGLAPILSVTITSILASSFSGAISSIAYPAQNYGVNAGLTSAPPPGQPQATNNNVRTGGGGKKGE